MEKTSTKPRQLCGLVIHTMIAKSAGTLAQSYACTELHHPLHSKQCCVKEV